MRQAAILMGALIYIGLTSVGGFAQENAKPETAERSPSTAMVPSEEIRMGGIIIAIDLARDKVLIQQYKVNEERIISLELDKEVSGEISAFRKGDAVNIWVKGNIVTKIEKIPDSVWEEIRKEGK
jgi:hypothetical protein